MADFNTKLQESTKEGANLVPGCILGAVDRKGESLFMKTAGRSGVVPNASSIDQDATFWAASCSKLVTTVAALQCVDNGQISLDDKIEHLLPELANPEIIKEDESEGSFQLEAATGKITLRQLLTHTSGSTYDMFNPLLINWRKSRGEAPMGLSGHVIKAYSTPLTFEPGQGWSYGGSVDWAGVVVSRLNGDISLEDYIQKNICKPLGMKSTTYRLEDHSDVKARLVNMSARKGDGELIPGQIPFPSPAAEDVGGAGIYTCVPDYLALLGDLIKESPTVLKKETVEQMFTPQLKEDSLAVKDLVSASGIISSMSASGPYEDGMTFGLGGCLSIKDIGRMRKGTLAWGGMPNVVWFANKERGVAGMYASQLLPPGDSHTGELVQSFIDEAYAHIK